MGLGADSVKMIQWFGHAVAFICFALKKSFFDYHFQTPHFDQTIRRNNPADDRPSAC